MATTRLSLSLDKVLGSLVAVGCTCLLGQAYLEGSAPLRGQVPAQKCSGRGKQRLDLSSELCRRLETDGYLVIDDFLTKSQVNLAVASLADDGFFIQSPNEQKGNAVRTDHICFFDGKQAENEQQQEKAGGLSEVRDVLSRLGYDIAASPFQGFPRDAYQKHILGVPDMMQISLYNKQGSYYRAHKDACDDSWTEMGLVGYLRSRYLQRRYLTCIVYLNPEWEPSHGGCLRIFLNDGADAVNNSKEHLSTDQVESAAASAPFIDVAPLAGRLVIFSSLVTMHAVLPTFSRRLACSMWLTLNED
jgi:hypothetical protein